METKETKILQKIIEIWIGKNMESVWRNDVETYPYYGLNYNNLAQFIMNSGVYHIQHKVNEIAWLMAKAMHLDGQTWEVHMNQACFHAAMGQIDLALQETNNAIALLEPLGGISLPLDRLKEQRIKLQGVIDGKNISPVADTTKNTNA